SKKERTIALFGILSEKAKESQISAFEGYSVEAPKTKTFANMLKKMAFKKDVLFVLPAKNEVFVRSARNVPSVKTILVNYVNPADLLKFRDVVFFKDALPKLEELFL
ncbi:MAG: 50S ribosomal protein L4, partial [Patescibacteria group bacterium]